MTQQDYNAPPTNTTQQELQPKFEKQEDTRLPQFTKEVPLRNIMKKHGSNVVIEYEWNVLGGEEIQISMASFRKDQNLEYVHKLRIKDGADVGYFKIANTTYIIRRTT
ncbi:MAG TPA: hypothetical protein PLL10_10540, partial [Elusimicrobiales bacterium]|nr:hypothetical protein [Elusimicrobiales bacterium]